MFYNLKLFHKVIKIGLLTLIILKNQKFRDILISLDTGIALLHSFYFSLIIGKILNCECLKKILKVAYHVPAVQENLNFKD